MVSTKLNKVKEALTSIDGLKVYHYWHPKLKAPYCIWQEDSEGESLHSNNEKSEQVIDGTIDYYTLKEFDPNVDNIQEALKNAEGIGWRINSVQYEDETNLIHYEWSFSVA